MKFLQLLYNIIEGGIEMKQILIINGSLRKHSFNRQLTDYLSETYHHQAEFKYLDYSEVPFFNEDIENPLPDSVLKVKKEVENADAIIIAAPEYNGYIPGVLKNLLDWLSRPVNYKDYSSGTVLNHKPVTIVSAAGSSEGIHARTSLKLLLERLSMHVIADNGTGIALNREAFTTNILHIPEKKKQQLHHQMNLLLDIIEKDTNVSS